MKGITAKFLYPFNEKRYQASAIAALREAAQAYILDVMGGVAYAAAHAKRVTAMVQDIWLVMELSGEHRRRGTTFPRLTLKEATKYIPPTGLQAMGHDVRLLPVDSKRDLRGSTRPQYAAMPAGAKPDPAFLSKQPMEAQVESDFEEPFSEEAHFKRHAEAEEAAGVAPAWAKGPDSSADIGERQSRRQRQMRRQAAQATAGVGETSRESSRPEDEQDD